MNKKEQGAIGVGRAIAYYMNKGYAVFVPVSDIKRCDLVVLTDTEILKVEVKTTKTLKGEVQLRTAGGNQTWNGTIKRISCLDCDRVLAVNLLTNVEKEFLSSELEGRTTVTVK